MILQILTVIDPHSMKNVCWLSFGITINGNHRLHEAHLLLNSTRGQDTRRNTVIIIFYLLNFYSYLQITKVYSERPKQKGRDTEMWKKGKYIITRKADLWNVKIIL